MTQFYIDQDLKQKKIYILPHGKSEYVILCENMHQAQNLLRKLNAQLIHGPQSKVNPSQWILLEEKILNLPCYRLK
jgi:hypothetical protein